MFTRVSVQRAAKTSTRSAAVIAVFVVVSTVSFVVLAGGCSKDTDYYRVRDPQSGRVFFTKSLDRHSGSGAVTLVDGASGQQVTLPSSEVQEITKKQYYGARKSSGQTPDQARQMEAAAAEARAQEARAVADRAAAEAAAAQAPPAPAPTSPPAPSTPAGTTPPPAAAERP